MLGRNRLDHVAVAPDGLAWIHFGDIELEADTFDAELRSTSQMPTRTAGTPKPKRFDTSLQRHRPHETDDANDVIGVEVGEENVLEYERDAIPHHLSLSPFAAVEQHGLSLANEREGAHVALDGGASGGRPEEAECERHDGEFRCHPERGEA